MKGKYICIDVELGGAHEDSSILTAYFGILSEDLELIDSLDLCIKPDDGAPYVVEAQGLEVNGINLVEHHKVAFSKSHCGSVLNRFLQDHTRNGRLIPVGHGILGDITRIQKQLLSKKHLDKYTAWRKIDTGVVAEFLKMCGLIPEDESSSLSYYMKSLSLKFKGKAHTAEADALGCVEVLKKFREIVVGGQLFVS